nr:sodium/hydrogen exchanger 3 isoform X1 [Danaus plexippus plexippus]XP_032520923.1 sodium/hydrogen exchanger 3 isoform X1 [Danaus plexippus plexippus]XP_032520924.1 sodium/hydrogen exchanger 3 isoform X1 [Danaus plexippus plexippus]XP_032520925.1 sodium/hydrogen exchanger 3 isoform X1 [Danaus plexippus plexippus]XP_032520926.1 sodium/hydrogen exchanger 3 isoform X1 [Danaus plexippus plexippus]XP_032520927.1 sodium/hydrogen exchanger 3 isoform X1 [Danaus plexippus plexippus]
MTSLKHGVNLSRRACRQRISLLAAATLLSVASANPIESTTKQSPSIIVDGISTYPGLGFGPMGPVAPLPGEPPGTQLRQQQETTTQEATTTQKPKKERTFVIAAVEFHRVETPFLIGVWIFFASLAKIGFHMAPKLSKMFPESCLLIFVGVLIGALLLSTHSVHVQPLTPDTFFLYMLPPIILDAGYFMPNRLFFDHLGTILLFAVVGTVFNTITIGASLWACGQTGMFGCTTPLLDMLLFGALISAVDPVAVLAVFEEIHVDEVLYIVVFGESLLNDAVTVVLYHMFEAYTEMGPSRLMYTDFLAGFASFLVVAVGGTCIGVVWGFGTGLVTRFTNEVRVIEPIFIFVMAYLAYLNAEMFHMSGILAITFCGITMKNYVEANISHKSHTTIKYTMKMLSSSSETIIFMFLGVATVNNNHDWNTWFVLLTIVFCSVFRIIGVYIFSAVANKFRLHKLNTVEKFVMSYGGLRGAVAFALVLLIDPEVVKLQPMFVTTTIAVIYFTVFIQGITIKPLVKILNVKTVEKRKPTMNERIHERFMDHLMAGIEDILGKHGNHHMRDKFKRFDNRFIRPFLLRNYQGQEPKILETYSKLAMRDAIEYMQRNASTIGNISGAESMSAIFKNYTNANFNGSPSFSQLDSSTWNIDMQELEYNPSKKDLTDARIHHLLAEELCKPYRRHRRLSYSRHAVNDRDLGMQVNYKTHMNIRRLVGDRKHHHKRSKRGKQDGKNHVTFPEFQQNGSAKQFTHGKKKYYRLDYIDEVLQEDEEPRRENDDGGITFTAKTPPGCNEVSLTSSHKENSSSLLNQLANLPGFNPLKARIVKQYAKTPEEILPTAVEKSLPWRRDRSTYNFVPNEDILEEDERRMSDDNDTYMTIAEQGRVATPTATETMLPWKREEAEGTTALKQSEFPSWASNKEYLAYSSPSATFLGGIEKPKHPKSIIGLFRRESTCSQQAADLPVVSDSESKADSLKGECSSVCSTKGEPLLSQAKQGPSLLSKRSTSLGGPSVLLMEDVAHSDPLGASSRPASIMQGPHRGQCRRGSMLELTGSLSRDAITEEKSCKSLPESERMGVRRLALGQQSLPRESFIRQPTIATNLLTSSSSDESSDEFT